MNMVFWFLGASIIFTAFLLLAEGWSDWAIEGNGRRARDEGKDVFRFGITR